jgi:hypothetical protein
VQQGRLQLDPVGGRPTVLGRAFARLAGDGGVDAGQGIHRIDRIVAAERLQRARIVDFEADLYYTNAASHLKAVNGMFLDVLKTH